MIWLLILGVVVGAALLCEVAIRLAPELFGTARREAALKEEISKLHHDLTHAEKRIDSLKSASRSAEAEIDAVRQEASRIDQEMARRKNVPPLFVYRVGPPSPTQLRYRAPLTKRLSATPEPHQALVWKPPCVVETWAHTPRQASQAAAQQFRPELGYTVGAFARREDPAA